MFPSLHMDPLTGFTGFHPDDQLTLVKAGALEVTLISYHHLMDLGTNSIYFPSLDEVLTRQGLTTFARDDKFVDLWFTFAARFIAFQLRHVETGLFCALLLISSDRQGLRDRARVSKTQELLIQALQVCRI